eukprot:g26565.t1
MITETIRALGCWKNPIHIEPISGGITNRNFLVVDGEQRFVVRVCEDRRFLGIDRNNERLCQIAAQQAGVSPELVRSENGMLVTRFIDGPTIAAGTPDPPLIERLADLLRRLHACRESMTGELLFFCPFQTVRTYAATARTLAAPLPDDIDDLLNDAKTLSRDIEPYHPTLCHNDLLPANILDEGDRLWLIDWEYAGIGNPLFDLASLSANCRFGSDDDKRLVEAYSPAAPAEILPQIRSLKAVSLLREALWAAIQTVKSDFEFDYAAYAQDNFSAFRATRLHGNPHLKTPHIDSLGKDGIRFERFYVNSFCAPTRAALLTGRYPLRCGVWGVTHNKETMRADEVTLAEALRGGGYKTACIGKWHNGEQFPYTPPGQGFDRFFGFHNGHINNYFNTELIDGSRRVPTKGYITDVLTDDAIRFIDANSERPFFCYVSYNAPHSPYQVPDRFYDRFRAKGLSERVSAFYGMCENIDENVGRLLATLKKKKIERNTIVLFLTDNGGTAGVKIYNAGMRGGKTSVHEGGCRVPLFIRWPERFTRPRVVKQISSHIDLYPTLLDLCNVPRPKGPPIDGVSLRPLLEGRGTDWPARVLFTHNPISATNRYPGAVRTQRYRLVRTIRGRQGGSSATPADANAPPWKLFDMQTDPGEKQDLAKLRPKVVARLSRLYEKWIDDTSRRKLTRLPIPVGHKEEDPVSLNAPQAFFNGSLRFYRGPGFAHDWLTGWTDTQSKAWFEIDVVRGGTYELTLEYGCPKNDAGSTIVVRTGSQSLSKTVPAAEAPFVELPHRDNRGRTRYMNRKWGTLKLGRVTLEQGRRRIAIEAKTLTGQKVLDLKSLSLKYIGEPRG